MMIMNHSGTHLHAPLLQPWYDCISAGCPYADDAVRIWQQALWQCLCQRGLRYCALHVQHALWNYMAMPSQSQIH
jgi:hypothetical protein